MSTTDDMSGLEAHLREVDAAQLERLAATADPAVRAAAEAELGFRRQLEVARGVMRENRAVLAELAK